MSEFKERYLKLLEPFDPKDIEWKSGSFTDKNGGKALAMAYLNARAIMNRLDDVLGAENWQDTYQQISGEGGQRGFICTIHIRIGDDWIGKSDAADESDFEAIKGGISDAFKRAANKWGIGRYLYNLDAEWVKAEKTGKYTKLLETPKLPAWAVPENMRMSYAKTGAKQGTLSSPAAEKKTVEKKEDKALVEKARGVIIPVSIAVPFAGKTLGEAFDDASVGKHVVRFLTGAHANQAGQFFVPDKEQEAVREAAKVLLNQ